MRDQLQYEGKRVIVTGAASGIGAATAGLLTELGAEVRALDAVEREGVEACDLRDEAAIDAFVASVDGPVDALFNCAGLPNTAPHQQILLVNFVGHRHLTESLVPRMAPGSSIGFVSSVAGMDWVRRWREVAGLLDTTGFDSARRWCEAHDELLAPDGYGMSKIAINAYTARRGFELAPDGIRVNATMPGPTATPMLTSFAEVLGEDFFDRFPKPIGRTADPVEQAWSLAMLCSPRSSYVTATTLLTDGGYSGGLVTGGIDLRALIAGTDPA